MHLRSQPDRCRNIGERPLPPHTFTNAKEINNGEKEAPQLGGSANVPSWYGTAPPAVASPEPVGNVAATCSGECRRSTQHAVERLRQPDGSVIVRRKCTTCDAVEQITISKVVAERVLNAD